MKWNFKRQLSWYQESNKAYEIIAKSKCDVKHFNQKSIIHNHNAHKSVSIK